MRPIAEMPTEVARRIEILFTDIDDTLTTSGRIPRAAFESVWKAHDAGIEVVLVTGRPAGWCDHLARMWPVSGVVGENGALAFAMRNGRMERLYADRPPDSSSRLDLIRKEVLKAVKGCKVAADQSYREYDLAIDFCEEVDPLPDAEVDRIVEIFQRHGATAKVSSIHVNGWFGRFDKLTMCRRFCNDLMKRPLDPDRATFSGDSPNDEPMFEVFPHACAVANIERFVHRMKSLPAYVTPSPGGEGFAELVDHLSRSR